MGLMLCVKWCDKNHLQINDGKIKGMVTDFCCRETLSTAVNIQGVKTGAVSAYKLLCVHLNNTQYSCPVDEEQKCPPAESTEVIWSAQDAVNIQCLASAVFYRQTWSNV